MLARIRELGIRLGSAVTSVREAEFPFMRLTGAQTMPGGGA